MPVFRRRIVLPALALLAFAASRGGALVINEVDADTPGTDAAEFVELYDGGAGNTSLDGYVLVFFNGALGNDGSYQAYDLDGKSTDANGYFVLCGNAANVPTCDLDVSPNTDLVQNGADAVALYLADATAFPSGTPPTTTNLVDALVYDTNDADDAGLLTLLNPGEPQVNESANAAAETESNQRCPNGSGGARNTASYDQFAPTAGAVNGCGGPATPTLTIADAAIAEGDSGTVNLVFTVTVNPVSAGTVSFDIATSDGSATDADNDYEPSALTNRQIVPPATTYQFTVAVNGDTTLEPNETFTVTVTNLTGADPGDLAATGTILNDEVTAIHDVQGAGASSPLAGQAVVTRGIVTGVKPNGFFLQAKDAEADADPATSEGVFVFTSSAPPAAAALGNEVQVSGSVSEFVPPADPQQPPLTEISGTVVVAQLSTGNPLPAPVALTAGFPAPGGAFDQLERLEGMRVSVASLTVGGGTLGNLVEASGATTSNGVFYGVVTGVPRAFRESGVQQPDDLAVLLGGPPPANIPRFDTNSERIRVDSDGLAGGPLVNVRAGQTVAGLIGPLDYTFRTYTILPDAGAVIVPAGTVLPGAAALPAAGEVTVGSYNLERFFDTVDDPATSDVALTPAWYLARMDKASKHIREFLNAPDILAVVEVENNTTLLDLAGRISVDAIAAGQPDPQYDAYLVEGNDIGGIDVGFLIRTRPLAGSLPRVELIDLVQEGKTTTWIDPSNGGSALLNDRPPLRLRAQVHSANGSDFALTVVVVHQRSLNGIDSTEPTGTTTTGNRVRQKRRAQSEFLANLLQARQVADPNERIVVVGDFNAFEDNDGFVDVMGTIQGTPAPADQVALASADLVNPDFVRLSDSDDYSFVFDGNAQNLDHAIVNAPLIAATTARRLDHARVNADFTEVDRATSNVRLSDHDPLVAYLEVGSFADAGALFRDDFERGTIARWSGTEPPSAR